MTIVSVTLGTCFSLLYIDISFNFTDINSHCDNMSKSSPSLLCSSVIDPREDGPDRSGGRHH